MDAREQLLEAALRVYSTAGTRGATTRRIAREAGVNEVTLFRHFGSKEALLRDAVQLTYDRSILRRLPREPLNPALELTEWCRLHHEFLIRMRSRLRITMAEFVEHPDHVEHACRVPLQISDELHTYVRRLRARGLAAGRWHVRAAAAMLLGAVFQDAMQRDIMPELFPGSPQDAVRQYVALFLTAIGARPRPRRAAGINTPTRLRT